MYGIKPAELDPLKDKRFLVVDDERVNIQFFINFFEDLELNLEVAHDGRQAVDLIFSHPPNYFAAVLMDVRMPKLDGTEATELIKARAEWSALPIIAMTGNHEQKDHDQYLEAGMVDLLPKPANLRSIIDILTRWATPLSPQAASMGKAQPQDGASHQPGNRAMHTLPGVDMQRRIQETGIPMEGYKRLLKAFLISQQSASADLGSAIANRDYNVAGDAAHKLAGACGNIGADELRLRLKRVQHLCESETSGQELQALLRDVAAQLPRLCDEIERFCSE